MIDFFCKTCANHVQINIPDRLDTPAMNAAVEAWCHNKHRPVRMTTTDPHAD